MNAPDQDRPEENISKEMLMMYGDGKLPLDQRPMVTEALMRNPALVRELDSYLYTRDMPVLHEAMNVPPWLTAAVASGRLGKSSLFDRVRRAPPTARWALAAALAILLAGGSGWLVRDAMRADLVHHDERGLVATTALQRALETTPVGATVRLDRELALRPRSTFYSVQKRWYRHYDLIYSTGLQASGLASRGPDGSWLVVQQNAAAKPAPDGRVLGPDSGLIEALRDKIIDGSVLPRNEEETVIAGRWLRR